MPEIENYDVYNDRMRRSMWDKAFFMDKVYIAIERIACFLVELYLGVYKSDFDIAACIQSAEDILVRL